MKKTAKIIFITLILLTLLSAVFGCEKKPTREFLTVEDIPEIAAVQEDGTLYFEWIGSYDPTRPLLVVFHGEESAESTFTINMSKAVYSDVMISNAGHKGIMPTDSKNTYYDISYFWREVAEYNIAVFHWERFSDETETSSVLAKIFSTYKSRYKVGGVFKEEVFSVPLCDVVFALYLQEMQKVSVVSKEIRFVGAGAGALLAEAVAAKAALNKQESVYPYRVALCDAPIAKQFLTFDTSWLGAEAAQGTVGLIEGMNKIVKGVGTVLEVYETKEVSNQGTKYAYDYASADRSELAEIKKDVAFLTIAESYSAGAAFDMYKLTKRLALDWYLYSVIGSDDTSVGCRSVKETQDLAVNNRAPNDTRPILNERFISNAEPEKKGRNYGLAAWTPTVYIRALQGISFSQKTGAIQDGTDIHGYPTYHYRDEYILNKFSSENYQVADRSGYTVVCGYVFYDKNNNGYIDDGISSTYDKAELSLSLTLVPDDTQEQISIFSAQTITSASDGFFVIRFEDATSDNDSVRIQENRVGLCVVSGIGCKDQGWIVGLSFNFTKGITSYQGEKVKGVFYSTLGGNGFVRNQCNAYLTQDTAHSLLFANCAYIDN